jgi:glycosyltransferase involved in cell wall biosynthesis
VRIIWLKSDYIDPPDTGGKIRTYNLLRQLRSLCNVTYLSLTTTASPKGDPVDLPWASQVVTFPQSEEPKEGLKFYSHVLARMFSTQPFIVQKYRSREIRQYQRRLHPSFGDPKTSDGRNVLVCDFLEMAGNVVWSARCPKILFQHNVESTIWRRYFENEENPLKKAYFWFEYQRLKRFERIACNQFDLVLAVSAQDKYVLQHDLEVRTPVEVIETGVDVEFFAPPGDVDRVPGRLLFLGSLDWMPNIDGINWFVREIYPRIKAKSPHVTLDIVGRRPTAAIRGLSGADSSIRVCGSVPDVRPYIAAADLFVVPLRVGSGTRLKIFEAMAMRCPVVSTTVGAEGLPVQHDRHLLLADSAQSFSDTVVSILADPARKQTIAATGYEFVVANYSWKRVGAQLYDVCRNVCEKTSGIGRH